MTYTGFGYQGAARAEQPRHPCPECGTTTAFTEDGRVFPACAGCGMYEAVEAKGIRRRYRRPDPSHDDQRVATLENDLRLVRADLSRLLTSKQTAEAVERERNE